MRCPYLIAIAGVLALSTPARADVICDHCEQAVPGTYLGGYWPGDRGTFQRSTPTVADANGIVADDLYVIDFYQQGTITLAVGGALPVWVHVEDGASTCSAVAGEGCSFVDVGDVYKTKSGVPRKASTGIDHGRFVIRVKTSRLPPGVTYSWLSRAAQAKGEFGAIGTARLVRQISTAPSPSKIAPASSRMI